MQKIKEQIYTDIKNKVIYAQITPGSSISETTLALEYNISRTPIREILQELTKEGLIYKIPNKGTFITKISLQRAHDLIFLRKCVEPEVFKIANKIAKEKTLQELKENLKKQKELQIFEIKEFHELDNLFHNIFYKNSNKKSITTLIGDYSNNYNRIRVLFDTKHNSAKKIEEHENIIKLFENNDYEGFKEFLGIHLQPLSEVINIKEFGVFSSFIEE